MLVPLSFRLTGAQVSVGYLGHGAGTLNSWMRSEKSSSYQRGSLGSEPIFAFIRAVPGSLHNQPRKRNMSQKKQLYCKSGHLLAWYLTWEMYLSGIFFLTPLPLSYNPTLQNQKKQVLLQNLQVMKSALESKETQYQLTQQMWICSNDLLVLLIMANFRKFCISYKLSNLLT